MKKPIISLLEILIALIGVAAPCFKNFHLGISLHQARHSGELSGICSFLLKAHNMHYNRTTGIFDGACSLL